MQRVSLPTTAWVKPGIAVLSVTAITTMGFAGTASASMSQHRLPAPSTTAYQKMVSAMRSGLRAHMSVRDILSYQGLP
ncbi:MAG: hypothetical protein JO074_06255, partial [Frankiales bacterium]|nr:hypothetical protein [Frankiales bacterium]